MAKAKHRRSTAVFTPSPCSAARKAPPNSAARRAEGDRLTAGGKTQAATVRAGSSYLSVSDRRVYFGLGGASTIETVEVHWPSGTKDVWKNVAADGFYTLTEGEGIAPTAIRGRTKR